MLSNALGIRPLDIRQTLPNLKYLLYIATAGKGEMPARKAGGIKGLLRGEGVSSRKGSFDSTASRSSFGDGKEGDGIGAGNGNGSLKIGGKVFPGSRLRPVE